MKTDFTADPCGIFAYDQVEDLRVVIEEIPIIEKANLHGFEVNKRLVETIYCGQKVAVLAEVVTAEATPLFQHKEAINVWIGKSTENTDPSLWRDSSFVLARYVEQEGRSDIYKAEFQNLREGKYYFALRVQIGSCNYKYGTTNDGFWMYRTNSAAVLNVIEVPVPVFATPRFEFCASEEAFIEDFLQLLTESRIAVYASENATVALKKSALLKTGTYYLSQTISNCESAKVPVSIFVKPLVLPDFPISLTICKGAKVPVLETTAPNGITGKWLPESVSNLESGIYVFTPNEGECALPLTFVVTVNAVLVPNFATELILYSDEIIPVLETISPNGIKGTWSPPTINAKQSGTYLFTPNEGQCSENISLAVTVE